jgi:hypothetical protein
MCIRNGATNIDESLKKFSKLAGFIIHRAATVQFVTGSLQVVTSNELHGIKRSSIAVGTKGVNGNDPGVFQSTGDFGFENESLPS